VGSARAAAQPTRIAPPGGSRLKTLGWDPGASRLGKWHLLCVADVFISYSRRDKEFVARLHEALDSHGKQAWVDWEDIPPSAEWLREIHDANVEHWAAVAS